MQTMHKELMLKPIKRRDIRKRNKSIVNSKPRIRQRKKNLKRSNIP